MDCPLTSKAHLRSALSILRDLSSSRSSSSSSREAYIRALAAADAALTAACHCRDGELAARAQLLRGDCFRGLAQAGAARECYRRAKGLGVGGGVFEREVEEGHGRSGGLRARFTGKGVLRVEDEVLGETW